jgi:hypothetical protein
MTRERLPDRRPCETLEFERDGIRVKLTVGFKSDGQIGEIFINAGHANSMMDAILSDVAIVASLALQHGCTVRQLAHSIKRDHRGLAASPLGAAIDRIYVPEEVGR